MAVSQLDELRAAADSSRVEKQRDSLRNAYSPTHLMNLLEHTDEQPIARQILRLFGNLCIDDEATRSVGVDHLGKIAKYLQAPQNFDVAAGVVSNIFSDDSIPTDSAIRLRIHELLAIGLSRDKFIGPESPVSEAVVSFLTNLVDSNFKTGPISPDTVSAEFLSSMLLLPTLDWDEDIHDETLEAAVTLLSNEDVQKQIAATHSALLLATQGDSTRFKAESILIAFMHLYQAQTKTIENEAAAPALIHDLQNHAGDIAYMLEYRDANEIIQDPLMDYFNTIFNNLESPLADLHDQTLAFIMLGNIARKKDLCLALGQDLKSVHWAISLIQAVDRKHNPTRWAAVGALYNLANAEENKNLIRDSKVIHHLCNPDFPEGLQDGLRLLRSVIRDSSENCRRLLMPEGENSKADEPLVHMDELEQWFPTMTPSNIIEVGRLIVTILRTVQHDSSSGLDTANFVTEAFVKALVNLTNHGAGNMLASEGLVGLALASRTSSGASLVRQALEAENPPYDSLKKALGQDPKKVPTASQDRENTLVILTQLSKSGALSKEANELMANVLKDHMDAHGLFGVE